MVSVVRLLSPLLVAALAGPSFAQTADWARAGGPLFVTEGPSAGEPPPAQGSPQTMTDETLDAAALRQGIDPKLLRAVVAVESGYRVDAVSPVGAAGLTQLMPATAAELGVTDRFDARQNLDGGARYLARQVVRFGDLRLALAAFNAGPETVNRLGRIPRFPETRLFVRRVVSCYLALAVGRAVRSVRDCPDPEVAP